MSRYLGYIKYVVGFSKASVLLFVGYICSLFYKKTEIWIFRERGTDARDNGYWMFRYIKETHPEIEAYYSISKNSPDRKRLEKWEAYIIEQNSLQHYIYMWRAKYMISTHICGGYPNSVRRYVLLYKIVSRICPKKNIWLQHGVTINDLKGNHKSEYNNLDLFVCSANPEYDFIRNNYGYPNNVVRLTGQARFDQLHEYAIKSKQLLFMPTWRKWLNGRYLEKSEYFLTIKDVLTSANLQKLLTDNGLTLIFYPHHEIQPFIDVFKSIELPNNIVVADKHNFDVQQLLKESKMLITDYSSVSLDFAYMKKSIIYFLFDEHRFLSEHYANGYFDYHNGFGPYALNVNELIQQLENSIKNGMNMSCDYIDKVNNFFAFFDTNNCSRIYEAIKKL